ncbi:hypothetical protein CPB83DRAFT_864347 [Crepidotus variabilis]|uniref:Pheromone n=1 Tax=Crepidotus variabilis TaxID=179855 RepID=A0A9P6E4T0_9AGAR|nr:hypothetical protein CPB83DRAFT_864347 [Crepidotus variabilis]
MDSFESLITLLAGLTDEQTVGSAMTHHASENSNLLPISAVSISHLDEDPILADFETRGGGATWYCVIA